MSMSLSQSTRNDSIWSKMLAVRQLSATYYTISTCLSDLLHRYNERIATENRDLPSSLLENICQGLFSSSVPTSNQSHDQQKLLAGYANLLQTILQQNTLHTNLVQSIRRLFRSDSCLKQLFTTELNEYSQCQECDCTTSNSINDVIHDVSHICSRLLIDSCSVPCACFRCGDSTQQKTLSFQKCSPCLALTVNQLDINATDTLTDSQGVIYDLVYIIEFDVTSRSIVAVYQREDQEFVQVDGVEQSQQRISSIKANGKFLTLWLSQSTSNSTTTSSFDAFLSPPQSASSSTQNLTTTTTMTTTTTTTIPATSIAPVTTVIDSAPLEASTDNDDDFWNSLTQSFTDEVHHESDQTNDSVSDLYLKLLHNNTSNKPSPIKSRSEHDRTVNTLAVDVLWPLILDQTNRRPLKKSNSSTTTTVGSQSSMSSVSTSSFQRRRTSYKQLSSTTKSQRVHPYSTSTS